MAEPVVVRVEMVAGNTPAPTSSVGVGATPRRPAQSAIDTPPPNGTATTPAPMRPLGDRYSPRAPSGRMAEPFDATSSALARIEREARARETDDVYRELRGLPSRQEEAATKQSDMQKRQQQRDQAKAQNQAAAMDRIQDQQRQQSFGLANQAFSEVGNAGIASAVGSPVGAVAHVASAVGSVAKVAEIGGAPEVAAIAGPAGAAATALTGLGSAAASVTTSLIERGRELSAYSPQLAGAQAVAGVRELGADIRESNYLGDSLARLTDTESRLEMTFREAMLPLKAGLIDTLVPVLDLTNDILKPIAEFLDSGGRELITTLTGLQVIKALPDILKTISMGLIDLHKDQQKKREDDLHWVWEEFLKLGDFGFQGGRLRAGDAVERAKRQSLNIPAFGH